MKTAFTRHALLGSTALLVLLLPLAAMPSLLFAQDVGDAAAGGAANPAGPELKINQEALDQGKNTASEDPSEYSVLDLIIMSGDLGIAFMVILALLSLAAMAVALERLFNLTRRKLLPPEFVGQLRVLVSRRESQPGPFKELCDRFRAPISAIFNAGLLRVGRPLTEMEKSMEDAAAREMATLRSRVRPLGVLSGVAPLVGLLGTVVGMIMAFQTASTTGTGTDKAAMLAEGIYLALLTTAAGLFIAIPAMMLAAYFTTRSEKFMREIDEELMEAMPCLAQMEKPAGAAAKAPQAAVAIP
jgi:biopolymer transport protein ExbB